MARSMMGPLTSIEGYIVFLMLSPKLRDSVWEGKIVDVAFSMYTFRPRI